MQVLINKGLLLNSEKKIGADQSCSFREKRKNAHFKGALNPNFLNMIINSEKFWL